MKTSTKNVIKLVAAAVFGFAFLSSFFSIFQSGPNSNRATSIIVSAFYFLLVAALLFSVSKANKKAGELNKKEQND
jgi:hypothetical protein